MSAPPGVPQAKHCRRPSVDELQWQEQALCVEVDSEIFFPGKGDLSAARAAKRVCAMCEVRSECLDYSLRHNEIHGVWGGLTERQRREYKRQRRDSA